MRELIHALKRPEIARSCFPTVRNSVIKYPLASPGARLSVSTVHVVKGSEATCSKAFHVRT